MQTSSVQQDNGKKQSSFERIGIQEVTLPELLCQAEEIRADSKDYLVEAANSKTVWLNDHAGLSFISNDGEVHDCPISRYALGQLGTKTGVPARYIQNCIDTGRLRLAQHNINEWLKDYNKNLFIRTYKGRVRGILTDQYSVCDSHVILRILNEIIDPDRFVIKGHFLNEERLHLRLTLREIMPIEREDLYAGFFLGSSDVGRAMLRVAFGLFKFICTNGLIVPIFGGFLFVHKHMSIDPEDFWKGLKNSLSNLDEMSDRATEMIKQAQQENSWRYDIYQLSEKETERFIRHIRSQTQLTESGALRVFELMKNKYGSSRWGMINSITEVARDYTLERRLELEKIAGDMLIM